MVESLTLAVGEISCVEDFCVSEMLNCEVELLELLPRLGLLSFKVRFDSPF